MTAEPEFLHITVGDPSANEAAVRLAGSVIGLTDAPVVALAKLGGLDGTIVIDGAALIGSNVMTGPIEVVDQQWLVSGNLSVREMVDAVIAVGQFPSDGKRSDDDGKAASGLPSASTELVFEGGQRVVRIAAIGPVADLGTSFVAITDAHAPSRTDVPALPAVLLSDVRAAADVKAAIDNELKLSAWRYQAGIVGTLPDANLPKPEWSITFEVPGDTDPATLATTLCGGRPTVPTNTGFHCVTAPVVTVPIWTVTLGDTGVLTATLEPDTSTTE